ncbi:ribonuclease P protein component [Gordonia sp. 852002-50816_SCH5313054-c]|uniref:Ribonuclease P protein component n=2 Tax=Gordoniaceae TaxID=85026 RepID=A0ABR5ICF1_9ACTN|nr:ribonuclease P [Gordonia jacobaea]OBC02140.1 ribonuclease P protein component [Gordonia sp. 852002-50395_SCH5434458]OBC11770.1 ribonuclease P protein component [Gordonia sp. 852002-50816_SCH5313054-c]OBC19838.1 ribonuclease P protein component [Gordonia sp. 852002-50816_SCH5313054-a]
MMASIHRISTRSDFSRTLKKGVRVSSRDLLLTLSILPTRWPDDTGRRVDVATSGGPWLGLIVSKSVGNAVTRHLVARRIRAAFAEVMDEFPTTDISVVVRALPSAGEASSVELAEQLRKALRNAKVRRLAAEVLDAPRSFSTESADGAL